VVREVRAWNGGSTGGPSESRVFDARFFNDRDVNISLWDAEVACYRGGQLIDSFPPRPAGRRGHEVGPIDLESRKSVYMSLELEVEGEGLSLLKESDRLEFVATTIPGGKRVRKALPTWDPLNPA
jgi:hypothetical protein